ncbi:MAG: hypothetical protein JO022_02300, partial [Acidobacteriaceae bacterium]|nr:hypothetical protein [Acidobacteriaceae bacterium]
MKAVLTLLIFAALSSGQDKGSIEGTVVNSVTGEAVKKAQVSARRSGQ